MRPVWPVRHGRGTLRGLLGTGRARIGIGGGCIVKSLAQINAARAIMRQRIVTPGLTDLQKATVMGVSNALQWAAGVSNTTMERLLSDEPMAAGKNSDRVFERLSRLPDIAQQQAEIEKLRDALSSAVVFIDACVSTTPAMERAKRAVLLEAEELLLKADEEKRG